MIPLQNAKYQVVVKQESATNGGTITSDPIDLLGADQVSVIIHATTSNNATNNPSVLKFEEGDTTSSYATWSGSVGDTDFTIPNSPTATTTKPFLVFNIDTRKRKRYIRCVLSPVTTQTYSVIAVTPQERMATVPDSDSEQNVNDAFNL